MSDEICRNFYCESFDEAIEQYLDDGMIDRNEGTYGIRSIIKIKNETQYGLSIYFSGPELRQLYIVAGGSSTVDLPNGEYRIAVKADGGNVSDYAGLDVYQGGQYNYSLYIKGQYHWNSPSSSVKYNNNTGTFDISY